MKPAYFKILLILTSINVLCLFLSCITSNTKHASELYFAVISNTYADSPYADFSPRLQNSIESINKDNPIFLIHLGGLVCGGLKWMGITEADLNRQYNNALKCFSELSPIFYTVKGKSDLLNTSSVIYERYTKRKSYYSFNYGDLHFIVLDSTEGNGRIYPDQRKWLIEDLKKNKNSGTIYVFINSVLFLPEKYSSFEEYRLKDYKLLHKYFTEYNIKAVFSGDLPFYFKYDVDGISYINTGCCGFNNNEDDIPKDCIQYYIVEINKGYLDIKPRYVSCRK